jgi:two-component system chemotaxis sensor kinase CheA
MGSSEKEFLKRLLVTFKIEAEEHIKTLTSGLLEFEKATTTDKQLAILEVIFREAHSLKGASRSVNISEMDRICQAMENVFAALKRQELDVSPQLMDTLHHAIDNLNQLMPALERDRTLEEKAKASATVRAVESIIKKTVVIPPAQKNAGARAVEPTTPGTEVPATGGQFQQMPKEHGIPITMPPVQTAEESVLTSSSFGSFKPDDGERIMTGSAPQLADTVRIPASRLEDMFRETEDLLAVKLAAVQLRDLVREFNSTLSSWDTEWSRVSPALTMACRQAQPIETKANRQKGLDVVKLGEFLDWNHAFIKTINEKLNKILSTAERDGHSLEGVTDNLINRMRQVMMLPFSLLLEISPKLVRDISREQGKDIDVVINGDNIEIDRRILEEMKDPLIHLLRNCVDHGIEKPAIRQAKGKPPRGTITITISPKEGNQVEMMVSDDGAGIDMAKVRTAAVKRGLISPEQAAQLDEAESLSLIYRSGVSTSPIITEVSGRGLGLAIVLQKVEGIRGKLSVETYPGGGTTFHITIPLTQTTFHGLVVRLGEQFFVIPSHNVAHAIRVKQAEIKTIENREAIKSDGQMVSFARLSDVLGIPGQRTAKSPTEFSQTLVIASGSTHIAFEVDEIIGEQEVLVKKLNHQLERVRNFSGVSILATGKIALLLNVAEVIKKANEATPEKIATAEPTKIQKKTILVAEDSITARILLKNILETAGYNVKTAVDGADALALVKSEVFDVVVTDVDMPRMNGFELTSKIRADKKLSETPVVIVTAMESREHRERGIEVGANAYIVKSSFDQSNLLDVISRLI